VLGTTVDGDPPALLNRLAEIDQQRGVGPRLLFVRREDQVRSKRVQAFTRAQRQHPEDLRERAFDGHRFTTDVTIRRFAEPSSSIVHWSEFERGGHFAALEAPDLLTGDIWTFFRSLR
jgi:hypothetical protein